VEFSSLEQIEGVLKITTTDTALLGGLASDGSHCMPVSQHRQQSANSIPAILFGKPSTFHVIDFIHPRELLSGDL
jgi:hypothetical protein